MNPELPVLILAAGSSSRMGTPKALLPWGDSTVLGHILGVTADAGMGRKLVVTGAHHDPIREILDRTDVTLAYNQDWETGMGSSIGFGITALAKQWPDAKGVFILLADQPMVGASYLRELLGKFKDTGETGIVASEYPDGGGVPAIFPRKYFEALQQLPPNRGARLLIGREKGNRILVKPGPAIMDMDTPEAYSRLKKLNNKTNIKAYK